MAEMTNAQVALMAAAQCTRTDYTETASTTLDRAERFLTFLNQNTPKYDAVDL